MKILVACEESQTVTKAFRKLGYEAFSCDIKPCSGGNPEWHIQQDAIQVAYNTHNGQMWDLMIAHPPCTFMSKAGARWMYQPAGVINNERLEKALEAKDFFMKLWNAPIPFVAIENPFPLKVIKLPKESQTIQPYQYGEPYSKKTLLWLNGLPELKPTNILTEYKPFLPSNTGGKKRGQSYMFKNISQVDSSKTFQGVADAMAMQWGMHVSRFIRNVIYLDCQSKFI